MEILKTVLLFIGIGSLGIACLKIGEWRERINYITEVDLDVTQE